ncbi:MAG: type IV secretion system protein [Patescibacteria group bacterium]
MLAVIAVKIKTFWQFLTPKRKRIGLVGFIICASLILIMWFGATGLATAAADIWTTAANLIGTILLTIAGWFIQISIFLLKFVITLGGYNGYIRSPAVNIGWIMVRDITNMFFVIVLLIIAFATILGIEDYSWKKLLSKLIFAAVLVNFSRQIAGIIIDFAQVIMITFINGVAATAGGNLINMFNVNNILNLARQAKPNEITPGNVFLASLGGLVFSAMMMVTMGVFAIMLLARMVMLWVLIVLSPLAFVLNVLPKTKGYADRWWKEFGNNVVSGPLIAFFIWLAFVTLGSGDIQSDITSSANNPLPAGDTWAAVDDAGVGQKSGVGGGMTWVALANFAIAIGMLMAGAKMAQELGVYGGSMLSSAVEKTAKIASGLTAARYVGRKGMEAGKKAGKFALMKAPLVGGEAWQARGLRIKSRVSQAWNKGYVEPRIVAAGRRIDTAFGKNEQGEFTEKSRWKRYGARLGLMFAPQRFKNELAKDEETAAKYAIEQQEHRISTSKTPTGQRKLQEEADLEKLKRTGQDIKRRKLQTKYEEQDEDNRAIAAAVAAGKGAGKSEKQVLEELEASGKFDARQTSDYQRLNNADKSAIEAENIEQMLKATQEEDRARIKQKLMAGEGGERMLRAAAAKAETKQMEDKLNAERELKELEEIKKVLTSDQGKVVQADITDRRAQIEQLNTDMNEIKERNVARARDAVLRSNNRFSEANNLENVLSKQAKQRIDMQSVGTDFPRSIIRTEGLYNKQDEALKELAAAESRGDQRAVVAAKLKHSQIQKSLAEMQIGNWEQHGAIGLGNMDNISKLVDPELLKNISVDPSDAGSVRKVQAAIFSSLIGEKVAASPDGLEAAVKQFGAIHGERSQALLEQLRLSLDKAAGQGVFSVAGLLQDTLQADGSITTGLTDAGSAGGKEHIQRRRTAARSSAKITSISAGLEGAVDKNEDRKAIVESDESIKIVADLLAPLTSTRLDQVDEYVKTDLGDILQYSDVKKLKQLQTSVDQSSKDRGAVANLIKSALERVEKTIKKEQKEMVKEWIKDLEKNNSKPK